MAKYYVRIKPQFSGTNAVHKEGCPFLQDNKSRIFLGDFFSSHDAIIEAQRYFMKSKGCLFCTKEQLNVENEMLLQWNMFSVS